MRSLQIFETRVGKLSGSFTVPSSDSVDRIRVRVTMASAPGGMSYFTPGQSLRWGRCHFSVNPPPGGEWDFWIVFGNALPNECARVAPGNTLFIAGEPPQKKVYPLGYYRQFAHVIDTHSGSRHPGLIEDALGLCWMVGLSWSDLSYKFGYDYLKGFDCPEKINKVSVICSNTSKTKGQRLRLRFLESLKAKMGERMVHFGKGFTPIEDKMDGIAPYRFNLVLENSQSPHYWTEKLTDAYLGWSFPFYVGCPNLEAYFDRASYCALDMEDVDGAVRLMNSFLEAQPSSSEQAAIHDAREQVMDKYNPFARFSQWVDRFYTDAPRESVTIQSEKAFRPLRGLYYRWQHRSDDR